MFFGTELSPNAAIYKNLIGVSLSGMFMFASFDDITSVSSILNQTKNLGLISLTVSFVTIFFGSLVLPQIMANDFSPKACMVIGQSLCSTFFVANMFPSFYTLIPSTAPGVVPDAVESLLLMTVFSLP